VHRVEGEYDRLDDIMSEIDAARVRQEAPHDVAQWLAHRFNECDQALTVVNKVDQMNEIFRLRHLSEKSDFSLELLLNLWVSSSGAERSHLKLRPSEAVPHDASFIK